MTDGPFVNPFDPAAPSFSALLRRAAPDLLNRVFADAGEAARRRGAGAESPRSPVDHVEGTTVLAVTYDRGVVMAADRRATSGNVISKRDMRKIFQADTWSAVGIAGAAGPAMELAKVFATELEFYEKVEGVPLSLEGKANKLGQMVRANLPLALQGFVVVPLFGGYDPRPEVARIYEYDAAGGRYEEQRFAATGSGGRDARGSLKARYEEGFDEQRAVDVAIEALWDAADEDSATGGPDLVRGIFPLVAVIDEDGYRELSDDIVRRRVEDVIAERRR